MTTQQDAINWLNRQGAGHLELRSCEYPGVKPGYFIVEDGRIISTLKGYCHFMTHSKAIGGYTQVCMTMQNGKTLSIKTHRLVAHAFLPNPDKLRTVNHKDENKRNNHYTNLEWMTSNDNNYHSKRKYYESLRGVGVGGAAKVTVEDIEDMKLFRANHIKLKDIARVYGISHTYVCNLTKGNIMRAA